MISRCLALGVISLFLFAFNAIEAIAQPSLPDISASAEGGTVTLVWNCQYDGIKTITVMRSADSANNYTHIGNVKKPEKGIQSFTDYHPDPGKNFYRLSILFNTGLTWSSNHIGIYTQPAKAVLPAASPPEQVITKETATPEKTILPKPAPPKLSITFDSDTSHLNAIPVAGNANKNTTPQQTKRINISFDDPESNPSTIITSRFIFTDSATGHVDMFLPEDVKEHHYSVKFYDAENEVIIDIPKINSPKIIIDKRNFQKAGVYKFILRRDVTEFESGYVKTPNP